MFTGLIETTGTVLSVQSTAGAVRMVISAPALTGRWHVGDSIAVNGVCLTALPSSEDAQEISSSFAADLAQETVERTTLMGLNPGQAVNLELPTPAGAPLGGHVVQGHVDGTGKLVSLLALRPEAKSSDWRMTLDVPQSLAAYIVPQGSLTVDGISLTVAHVSGNQVEIAVIPHTYKSTHLHSLLAGAAMNIEVDVLAKYAAQRLQQGSALLTGAFTPGHILTIGYLLANGY